MVKNGDKDRADQGNVPVKLRTHVAPDKVDQSTVDHFRHSLLPGNAGNLQTGAQPDGQSGDDDQNQPGHDQCLGDLNGTEEGYILKGMDNSCAID